MGDQLFFSRETKVYVQPTNPIGVVLGANYVDDATSVLCTNATSKKVSIGDELTVAGVSLGRVTAVSGRGASGNATFTVPGATVAGTKTAGAAVAVDRPIFEVPVLDGYSFSQATNTTEVGISEMSGDNNSSRRGRKIFTDSFAPAEWGFTTYARPFKSTGGTFGTNGVRSDTANTFHAIEEVLWGLWAGEAEIADAGIEVFDSRSSVDGSAGAYSSQSSGQLINFSQSNKVTLGTANIFFALGDSAASEETFTIATATSGGAGANTTIALSDADGVGIAVGDILTFSDGQKSRVTVVGAAGSGGSGKTNLTVAPGLNDQATTVTGVASRVLCYKIEDCVVNEAGFEFDIDGIAQIGWSGIGKIITEVPVPTPTVTEGITSTTNLIRNRLTKLSISSTSPTTNTYGLILTGGSITMSNNASFITPETIGLVNQPLSHITGARNVSGSFTCYLNTADNSSAELFETLLTNTSTITNNFDLTFKVGGEDATLPRVEVAMTNVHLELPTHSIEDLISVETNFHALPSTIAGTDEATIKYIGV